MRITNETTHTINAILCRLIIISYSKALISDGTKSPLASGEIRAHLFELEDTGDSLNIKMELPLRGRVK